jgi:hypothetical protein
MLLEAATPPPSPLPDVSRGLTLPGGVGNLSGMAGLNSGKDYADTIRKMAYAPLERKPPRARDMSHLDKPPVTKQQEALEKRRIEQREISNLVRRSASGSYSEPPAPEVPYDLPAGGPDGSLFPGADDTGSGNILLNPGSPELLPAGIASPVSTPEPFRITDIFKNL